MGILEKIAEIEKEIARTQKNKGTKIYAVELIQKPFSVF
jgi:ribosome-interacting GTPase 1